MKAQKSLIVALGLVLMFAAAAAVSAVEIDGKIAPGEYSGSAVLKKDVFTIHWQYEGDRIHVAMEAVSPGWIAIGFDPAAAMSKADMVFAVVGPGNAVSITDQWSTGMFGPHKEDSLQGGSGDILASAGTREGDRVVVEFTRLVDTKDSLDKVISGSMKVIWATGPDFSQTAKHKAKGSAKVEFGSAK